MDLRIINTILKRIENAIYQSTDLQLYHIYDSEIENFDFAFHIANSLQQGILTRSELYTTKNLADGVKIFVQNLYPKMQIFDIYDEPNDINSVSSTIINGLHTINQNYKYLLDMLCVHYTMLAARQGSIGLSSNGIFKSIIIPCFSFSFHSQNSNSVPLWLKNLCYDILRREVLTIATRNISNLFLFTREERINLYN